MHRCPAWLDLGGGGQLHLRCCSRSDPCLGFPGSHTRLKSSASMTLHSDLVNYSLHGFAPQRPVRRALMHKTSHAGTSKAQQRGCTAVPEGVNGTGQVNAVVKGSVDEGRGALWLQLHAHVGAVQHDLLVSIPCQAQILSMGCWGSSERDGRRATRPRRLAARPEHPGCAQMPDAGSGTQPLIPIKDSAVDL